MLDIIDTHQHLWNLDRLKLPWVEGVPALNRSFEISDYLKASASSGIRRTVYMEVDAHPDDNAESGRQSLSACHPDVHPPPCKQFV